MKKRNGVTMVTLIITVIVLGLLSSIAIYTVISENNKTVEKTKELKKEIDDKNIEEKILMADEEIKQLQNKRKKLISQQKQEERKKRDKRIYEKGAVFESIFIESKNLTKDEFYQLITSLIRKEEANIKILKIIESREETEVENTEKEDEETEIEE